MRAFLFATGGTREHREAPRQHAAVDEALELVLHECGQGRCEALLRRGVERAQVVANDLMKSGRLGPAACVRRLGHWPRIRNRRACALRPRLRALRGRGKAMRLSMEQAMHAGRGRWHLEHTGFCQWAKYWRFSHVFTHGKDALPALFYIFFLAFNLLQLFLNRQLGGCGRDRGSDVTKTIWRFVDEMTGGRVGLAERICWDTS
jgi:hypothetical protein